MIWAEKTWVGEAMKDIDITKCYNPQSSVEPYPVNGRGNISTRQNQPVFENDTVTCISDRAREMQIAWKAAKSAPDIRYEKVEKIKQALMEGKYAVHADQVAEKICESYFDGFDGL